jgi:nicotinate phosphoribosyltransferase
MDGQALFTDLYQLTMARAYLERGMTGTAVFELFFRTLPRERGFILAAGLDDALSYLESWRFAPEDLGYLSTLGLFPDDFLHVLSGLRFTGDVHAIPEGTAVFPGEPLIQVRAPIVEAQIVETMLINRLSFGCVAASKAARVVLAARGRVVADFGARRAHGTDAALAAARAAWLAGAAGTSNVLAGRRWNLPVMGTMAHSFVQAHESEYEAFRDFARLYPDTTLLVDTYDTLAGVGQVISLAAELGPGFGVRAIRLDSGDLEPLSRQARELLDAAGLTRVRIFASGDLDEFAIDELLAKEAPIDGFGVGTRLVASSDAPTLDMAYKLVEYAGRGRAKLSARKAVYPGPKQVWRFMEHGRIVRDLVTRSDENPGGRPLLVEAMRQGVRTAAGREDLGAMRERARQSLASLPDTLRGVDAPLVAYQVQVSDALRRDLEEIRREHGVSGAG